MFNTNRPELENKHANITRSNSTLGICINKEYESLAPPMAKEAFECLMSSIRERGQLVPIIINNRGEVLDGHNRLKVCEKLNIQAVSEVRIFDDPLDEKLYIIEVNLQRRQLTAAQRIQLSLKKKPILEELAKKNSQANLRRGGDNSTGLPSSVQICTFGRVNEKIAKDSGVSARQVSKVQTILEKARPELKERVLSGTTKIDKAYRQIINEERRLELIAQTKSIQDNFSYTSNRIKLLHGDMRKLAYDPKLIPDNSIDLIFTDPLYHREYLSYCMNLAEVANRVLKDGGSLVTYMN
jgi:ParB-like chromosome segregation protein Spo0J